MGDWQTMNVNEKGHVGLLKVMNDLALKGYECFIPVHDYSAIDLIVLNRDYISVRLQVKYRAANNNVIEIPMSSVVNGKKIPINRTAIDGWVVYVSDIDKVLYISSTYAVDRNYIGIRLVEGNIRMSRKDPTPMWNNFLDETQLWMAGSAAIATPC